MDLFAVFFVGTFLSSASEEETIFSCRLWWGPKVVNICEEIQVPLGWICLRVVLTHLTSSFYAFFWNKSKKVQAVMKTATKIDVHFFLIRGWSSFAGKILQVHCLCCAWSLIHKLQTTTESSQLGDYQDLLSRENGTQKSPTKEIPNFTRIFSRLFVPWKWWAQQLSHVSIPFGWPSFHLQLLLGEFSPYESWANEFSWKWWFGFFP